MSSGAIAPGQHQQSQITDTEYIRVYEDCATRDRTINSRRSSFIILPSIVLPIAWLIPPYRVPANYGFQIEHHTSINARVLANTNLFDIPTAARCNRGNCGTRPATGKIRTES